ncbi:hypothetical protein BJ170DRAFT_137603 [Xylariales sp. AK1849]|nr:hypothetical protein BJ170DRAFT_137603 [Xylariales sp. AK1849]
MPANLDSNWSQPGCSLLVDDDFGPAVDHCARSFDFTLLFEETILSILPSSIFLVLALFRIAVLRTRKSKVEGYFYRTVKLSILGVLLILCVVLVALWSLDGTTPQRTRASVPAAVLSMFECVVFMTLSFMEHQRSIGAPLLLDAYLLISILFDAVRVRTLWLKHVQLSIPILLTATIVFKLGILILEELGKRRWILPGKQPWSNEVTGGIFGRTLFAWLDRMMWKGYSSALAVKNLPDIDSALLSESLWGRIGAILENRKCLHSRLRISSQSESSF